MRDDGASQDLLLSLHAVSEQPVHSRRAAEILLHGPFYVFSADAARLEVRLGRLQFINDEFRQKGVDVLLSMDLVELAATGQISKAVIVTGDSDFAPAAKRARDKGVLVVLFYSPSTYVHDELFQSCDDRLTLDRDFFADILRP